MKKRLSALLLVLVLLLTGLCGAAAEEKKPCLTLNAVARYPKESYSLDLMGKTEYIPYLITIANTGEAPCALRCLRCETGDSRSDDTFRDTVLEAGQSITILHEQRFSGDDLLPGTESEGVLGVVEILFMVYGGENSEYVSNGARLSHFISASSAEGFPGTNADLVRAELKVTSASVHPAGYQAGEKITYQVRLENRSSRTLPALLLEELTGRNEAARKIELVNDLAPGERRSVVFSHTVEEKDLERGYLYSVVSAAWQDPATGDALICRSVPAVAMTLRGISAPQPSGGGVQLTASIVNEPANGAYYVPGEAVRVSLRAVNASSSALNQVRLTDLGADAASEKSLAEITSLLPGEEAAAELAYTVTELDALLGRLYCQASVQAVDVYGNRVTAISDPLFLAVDREHSGGGPATDADALAALNSAEGLVLIQQETSAPAQGGAYRAGETVTYQIILIHGADETIWDAEVWTALADAPLGRAERLKPGDFARFSFEHTVTEAEEEAGCVVFWAYAEARHEGRSLGLCRAEAPLVSPAGEGKSEILSQGGFALPLAGDGCLLTLLAKGSNAAEYSQHYCARHAELQKTVNALIDEAETDEELAAAWEQAASLWEAELEALYGEYLAAASGTARMAVIQEKSACFESLQSWQDLMTHQVYADAPVQAARAWAEEAMRRCLSLCGDGHSAPNPRTDSLFQTGLGKIVSTGGAEVCSRMTMLNQDETVQYRDTLCAAHSAVEEAAALPLEGSADGENARKLWFAALQASLNKLCEEGSEECRSAAALFALRMDRYLAAQAETLALLYPDDPKTAQEAAAQSAMRCVLALCREGLD